MGFYRFIRPLLWAMDPERAHRLALGLLRHAGRRPWLLGPWRRPFLPESRLSVDAFGLRFPNCLGLAAGLDKDGEAVPALAALGFGFVEVGTVTPRPQPGNPGVRLWRLPEDEALVNRMGFNNAGATALAKRLRRARSRVRVPVGVNIGKNWDTPPEKAASDYVRCLEAVHLLADYVVVNVSSPNTPGLRGLQAAPALDQLLADLSAAGARLADELDAPARPLLVKVAPDLSVAELEDIVEVCLRREVAGIVATNTTVGRPGLVSAASRQPGGLSGRPLFPLSTRVVAALYRRCRGRLPVIGVGGIMSATDAYTKIKAGATLVQVYTGFVYGGPGFAGHLLTELDGLLARDGFAHVSQAVGVEADRWPDP